MSGCLIADLTASSSTQYLVTTTSCCFGVWTTLAVVQAHRITWPLPVMGWIMVQQILYPPPAFHCRPRILPAPLMVSLATWHALVKKTLADMRHRGLQYTWSLGLTIILQRFATRRACLRKPLPFPWAWGRTPMQHIRTQLKAWRLTQPTCTLKQRYPVVLVSCSYASILPQCWWLKTTKNL